MTERTERQVTVVQVDGVDVSFDGGFAYIASPCWGRPQTNSVGMHGATALKVAHEIIRQHALTQT